MLNRLQHSAKIEVRIHDGDFPGEKDVDAKLVHLALNLKARLITNDFNLAQVAELQGVSCLDLHEIGRLMKAALLPGEILELKIVREGRDKGQGIGYLPDGTMVIVNNAQARGGGKLARRGKHPIPPGAGFSFCAGGGEKNKKKTFPPPPPP